MGLTTKGLSDRPDQKFSTSDQRFDTLYECKDFKIIKVSSRLMRTRHSSNYSLEKPKEPLQQDFDLPNLIKYTHLLQERIVDCLPVRSLVKDRHHAISTTSTIDIEKRNSESPLKSLVIHPEGGTPEEKSTYSEFSSAQNLTGISEKLRNIREQRKKLIEDDGLWS